MCLPTKNASIGTRQIPTSCMVIFGSGILTYAYIRIFNNKFKGGHTTEMLRMIKELDISKYSPMYFVTALVTVAHAISSINFHDYNCSRTTQALGKLEVLRCTILCHPE